MAKKKFRHGFTLGKFMPPHTGHLQLIADALEQTNQLTVLVCSIHKEPIPGELRFRWMQEIFVSDTRVEIVHVTDEVPSYPNQHPDFWKIWTELLHHYIKPDTEVFFSGEPYGDEVAQRLNIASVIFDRTKTAS